MRKVAGILLLALALVGQGWATEKWVEVSSPHFRILTDVGRSEGVALASQFEKMRETFSALLRAHPADVAPMLVVAVRNGKEFREIEPAAYLGKGKLDLAGYFVWRGPRTYILLRLDGDGPHPYATVYHEYTHYLLRDDYSWMPLWLNEGLAEFYQNTDIHSGEVDLGQPDLNDLMYLRTHSLIPIATLVQITASSPYYHEEQKGTIFYAESWALVHYLIVTDRQHGTQRLGTYERDLQARQDSLTAARNAFGSLHQMDRSLQEYLNHLEYAYFRLKLQTNVDAKSFTTRDVPETEANAIRAGVLVDNHRMSEARAMLKQVLAEDPNSPMGNQMMGYLEMVADNMPAAENWYAGALKLNPDSYEVNYRFAECAMRNADSTEDAKVEASLKKAMALNPRFAAAYDLLAQFYDIHQVHEHTAHMLEAQAISMEPDNVQYRLDAAAGLANHQDFANALRVLNAARHVARNHAAMAMIEEETARIEANQAMVARAQSEEAAMRREQAAMGSARAQYTGQTGNTSGGTKQVSGPMPPTVMSREGSAPVVSLVEKAPQFPAGPPTGAKHTVAGVVTQVNCYYPTMLVLTLDTGGQTLTLYRDNYYHVTYSAVGVTVKGALNPCTDLVGKHARIAYAEVKDPKAAGQIVTLVLVK
jgi:tetratricopeptide (TPR) repeat protein